MAEGTWVGLDVHARKVVAGVLDAVSGELRTLRVPACVAETTAWLATLPAPVRVAYEAGPTGYGLARACAAAGIACTVAAPSKIPRAPATRSRPIAATRSAWRGCCAWVSWWRFGCPSRMRRRRAISSRAREDARGELMRARHRLSKLLLRHGSVYEGSAWTLAHDAWLRRQRFARRPLAFAFDESYAAVLQAKGRRDALDAAIVELAAEPPFAEVVGRLVCLRGVATLTALALTLEIGDWRRFRAAVARPFLGLTRARSRPATSVGWERSPRPATPMRGGCSSRPPGTSAGRCARARRSSGAPGQPAAVRARADESARRLHRRWHALESRGKRRTIVAVAVARELAAHCWALATM